MNLEECLPFSVGAELLQDRKEPLVVVQMLEGMSQVVVQYNEELDYLGQFCSIFSIRG